MIALLLGLAFAVADVATCVVDDAVTVAGAWAVDDDDDDNDEGGEAVRVVPVPAAPPLPIGEFVAELE